MIETDIRELNERIKNESHFIDLINLEMSKVIVGQKHMTERLLIWQRHLQSKHCQAL